MAIYKLGDVRPTIGVDCFVAESADVVADVTLGDNVSVWNNAVIRGDIAPVTIGKNSNVQDLCMLHITGGHPLTIGENVTIGHSVTLHSCSIGDGSLIGMGSTILDDVEIGANSLVAAGSLITPGKKFPPRSFIRGTPAKLIRELSESEVEEYSDHYMHYIKIKAEYLAKGVVRI